MTHNPSGAFKIMTMLWDIHREGLVPFEFQREGLSMKRADGAFSLNSPAGPADVVGFGAEG